MLIFIFAPMHLHDKKKVIISVTNDLVTDQRVHKIAQYLHENNFEVTVLGRISSNNTSLQRAYKTYRFRLPFKKGPLFYAFYNLRLFTHLLFIKADVFYANDLDTLAANYLTSIIRKKEVVYDSHEYFTEVPELVNRKRIQSIWKSIEVHIVPKLKHCITVSSSIASIYTKKYGVPFQLVRNMPQINQSTVSSNPKERKNRLKIPLENKVIIYQGAINLGRGIELMVEAMQYLTNVTFLVLGGGDILQEVKNTSKKYAVEDKVVFAGKIPFEQLKEYTQLADLGISLEEDLGLNYRYALPNKIFDYIHCGIPVLVSNLPEMSQMVSHYEVGKIWEDQRSANNLATQIQKMLNDHTSMERWSLNAIKAQKELNWENESKKLLKIVNTICFAPHTPKHP